MARNPSKPGERGATSGLELGLELGALLGPHVDTLAQAARAREQAKQDAKAQALVETQLCRLDEAELMALVFEHLDPDNLRVCEGIDFDRLVILTRPVPAAHAHADADAESEREPVLEFGPEFAFEAESVPGPKPPDGRSWVGRSWAGDVLPTPAAVLERPELHAKQRALLVRASRRELALVNLRHLYRADALHHLELFVHACRVRRLRFCRVIPGKGVLSKDQPVIKRAVIDWCREHEHDAVLGWAPEIDQYGEWGAMILELRTRRARA